MSCMVGGKMPGGFNITSIKEHLSNAWGLGPGRSDGTLPLGTTMEPTKCLRSEPQGNAWLDTIVMAYTQHSGISLSATGAGGGSSSGGGSAMINSEEFLKFQAEQEQSAAQHVKLYMRYLKCDSCAGDMVYNMEQASLAKLDSITRLYQPRTEESYQGSYQGHHLIFEEDVELIHYCVSPWNHCSSSQFVHPQLSSQFQPTRSLSFT